jgi:hypothetical protein
MANQENFSSNVIDVEDSRILASRIINSETENILFEIIPASFGFEIFDNIELHFYSFPANNLYLSTTIRVTEDDILKSHIVSYVDGTFKNYIRIDFTRLFEKRNISLIPGSYRITMNFFSDEIGNYNQKKLYIDIISNSRTEVQLAYFNENDLQIRLNNINELREFVEPSFSRPVAIGVAEKIFKSGVELADDTEGLTYNNILRNINVGQSDLDAINKVIRLGNGVEEEFGQNIENILPNLYRKIREEIVIREDRRIQEDEFRQLIEEAVDDEIRKLQLLVDRRISIT